VFEEENLFESSTAIGAPCKYKPIHDMRGLDANVAIELFRDVDHASRAPT